jgi:hypothetical protein
MVFVRNPVLGKVKTRLARTIGDDRALEIYHALVSHTVGVSLSVNCDRAVFFSDHIDNDEFWPKEDFRKEVQQGEDLGVRMMNGFSRAFRWGYKNVAIIGSDCPELSSKIIETAFSELNDHDVVIGPASDGGYYLLGMKKLHPQLFVSKQWSTENVMLDTVLDLKKNNLSYALLETLSDIDEEKDLSLLHKILPL